MTKTNTEKRKRRGTLMLIAVLVFTLAITTLFVGTLAKYITSSTVSDDAVVAKFGLGVPGTINLFADSYTNVQADESGKKIIAPGTDGSYKFDITGTSEVAYQVSADITVDYSEEWGEYAPLMFSINGSTWTDFAQFETDLGAALSSVTMAPNSPYESTQTIYWRWPYSVSDGDDIDDTSMGALASAGTAPAVSIEINVTATQVD